MIIGIDASRAYVSDKTGTEYYSYHLINAMLRLPEARTHLFVLFIRPNAQLPSELAGYSNVIVKEVHWKYLWTQLGLAGATWMQYCSRGSEKADLHLDNTAKLPNWKTAKQSLDALWVPAHTLPILRKPGIKTVVTIHGLEYQWLPEYKNLLQRWYLPLSTMYAAKYADKLIAVSQFTANQLEKELHTSAKKIKVIQEGVIGNSAIQRIGDSARQKILDKYGIINKKYLLFVGSIQPRKNLVALIEAFAKVSNLDISGRDSPYKLVIAGGVGWMADDILRAPSRLGIQDKVVFTGRISENTKAALYQGAAIYIQPSVTEGFGLPVLEAFEHQVPVISSDGGALSEVVGDGGLIVNLEPNSKLSTFSDRLAIVIQKLLSDPKLQKKLINTGYKRVGQFRWESAAIATFKVLTG